MLLDAAALPVSAHAHRIERVLVADQPHVFRLRLGNQHPVDRIPMRDPKLSRMLRGVRALDQLRECGLGGMDGDFHGPILANWIS